MTPHLSVPDSPGGKRDFAGFCQLIASGWGLPWGVTVHAVGGLMVWGPGRKKGGRVGSPGAQFSSSSWK